MRLSGRSSFHRALLAASWLLMTAVVAIGCTPRTQGLGPVREEPRLEGGALVSVDGTRLPVSVWLAEGREKAVIVALHGFNMYRNYFAEPAAWWASQGLSVYAYDQRGFGDGPEPGIWGGDAAMTADARAMLRAVRARHPDVPIYLLGSSMGGAVALTALAEEDRVGLAGAVLVAPAVWGGEAMHPMFRASLWLSAHLTPWNRATGGGLRRSPTDNIDYLYKLAAEPQVIKYTRVDAIYGLTGMMGEGLAAARRVRIPLLVLYGRNDEIIPPEPVGLMRRKLSTRYRYVEYPDGWHMLLHDKQSKRVWRDIAAWIADSEAELPTPGFGSAHRSSASDPS